MRPTPGRQEPFAPGSAGHSRGMQYLYYWVGAGLAVVAIVAGIALGGWMWLATAILLPVALAIFFADRLVARKRPERRSSQVMNTTDR